MEFFHERIIKHILDRIPRSATDVVQTIYIAQVGLIEELRKYVTSEVHGQS